MLYSLNEVVSNYLSDQLIAKYWHPVLRWSFGLGVCVVSVLSLIPQEYLRDVVDVWDKLAHFACYAALALCGSLAYSEPRQLRWVSIGLVSLGGSLEIAQGFTVYRQASLEDTLANTLGVAAGLTVAIIAMRLIARNPLRQGHSDRTD